MAQKKIQSTGQSFTLIPEFREEIDARKLCHALILAAKEKRKNAEHTDSKKDAGKTEI